jgi:HEAT repeat protein
MERPSPDLLRRVVLGKDETIPRRRAFSLLREIDLPDKTELLAQVLRDERDRPDVRRLAAVTLYRQRVPETQEILMESSRGIEHPQVLGEVAGVLGRIGDRRALETVVDIAKRSQGRAAAQATFASQMIAHRIGADGYDLPVPAKDELMRLDRDKSHVFAFKLAAREEAAICLDSLASESLGVDHAPQYMFQIDCLPGLSQMLLTNRAFAGADAVERLSHRKGMLAVVANRFQETGRYSTNFVVFTAPLREAEQVRLLAHRPTGEQLFAGVGEVSGEALKFTMDAVARPGGYAIQVQGVFQAGRFEMSMAFSEASVRQRRAPAKGSLG